MVVYFSPACGGGKIYAKNLKFCIATVFVVCQRDNHKQYCCRYYMLSAFSQRENVISQNGNTFIPLKYR